MVDKPIINIKIPVSCKTVNNAENKIESVFESFFEFLVKVIEFKPLQYIIAIPLGFFVAIAYSIPVFIIGGWIIGSIIGIVTGHGHELMSDIPWVFYDGGCIGVVLFWAGMAIHKGAIKISCKDRSQ